MRTEKVKDTYGEPVLMNVGPHKIRVFHPILTDEERERRENALKAGCAHFMAVLEENRRKAEKE